MLPTIRIMLLTWRHGILMLWHVLLSKVTFCFQRFKLVLRMLDNALLTM